MAEVQSAVDSVTRGMREFLTRREAVANIPLPGAAAQFKALTQPIVEMVQDWLKTLEDAAAVEALRERLTTETPTTALHMAAEALNDSTMKRVQDLERMNAALTAQALEHMQKEHGSPWAAKQQALNAEEADRG